MKQQRPTMLATAALWICVSCSGCVSGQGGHAADPFRWMRPATQATSDSLTSAPTGLTTPSGETHGGSNPQGPIVPVAFEVEPVDTSRASVAAMPVQMPIAMAASPIQLPAQAVDNPDSTQLESIQPKALPTEAIQPEATKRRATLESMAMGSYAIEAGDSLEIKFRGANELNEVVTVRPDGMISLQIVGDVVAAGQPPEVLRRSLMSAYSGELKDPDISVIVRSFSGNSIYVGGEVITPGRVALAGRITTLNAIILAGGFKDTADQRRVVVRHSDGRCCEYHLKSVIECKGGQNIQLQPYDVVYVPKSKIAKVNLFVEQYIDKVVPFSRSFGIFISHNTGLGSAVSGP